MYEHYTIPELIVLTEAAVKKPVYRYGVSVHVECDPDWSGPDFFIDPLDTKGIEIFREFAAKMLEHYKTLLK